MNPEFILRPVREEDLGQVTDLVRCIAGGMTSLPDHPDHLAHRVNDSLRAFDPRIHKPAGETYLFVLEDLEKKIIIGTSGLLSRVGGFDPFYTYRIQRILQEYPPLNIRKELQALELVKNHKGPSEICSLYLHPEYRSQGLGKLLSLSRFSFIKAFPDRFDKHIIAELRGYIDEAGLSPFWEAVGNKFFEQDYYTVDILSGIGEKDFIEALLPHYPIYVDLLPGSARSVIAKVHTHTEPAKRILLQEGFHETNEVDIFDAGPILKARIDEIRTWKKTLTAKVLLSNEPIANSSRTILSNGTLNYRVTVSEMGPVVYSTTCISEATAEALQVQDGDIIQYVSS